MSTARFSASVRGGQISMDAPAQFAAHLARLNGKRVTVSIETEKRGRSNNQNRYYWGVVVEVLADELGWEDKEQLHEALKFKFLRLEAEPAHGRVLETVRSTSTLSTAEFEQYLDRIRTWAATEFAIRIPMPNEVDLAGAWNGVAA